MFLEPAQPLAKCKMTAPSNGGDHPPLRPHWQLHRLRGQNAEVGRIPLHFQVPPMLAHAHKGELPHRHPVEKIQQLLHNPVMRAGYPHGSIVLARQLIRRPFDGAAMPQPLAVMLVFISTATLRRGCLQKLREPIRKVRRFINGNSNFVEIYHSLKTTGHYSPRPRCAQWVKGNLPHQSVALWLPIQIL